MTETEITNRHGASEANYLPESLTKILTEQKNKAINVEAREKSVAKKSNVYQNSEKQKFPANERERAIACFLIYRSEILFGFEYLIESFHQ